jgi:hypothetical protein
MQSIEAFIIYKIELNNSLNKNWRPENNINPKKIVNNSLRNYFRILAMWTSVTLSLNSLARKRKLNSNENYCKAYNRPLVAEIPRGGIG